MWVKLAEKRYVNISNIAWTEPGDNDDIRIWFIGDKSDEYTVVRGPEQTRTLRARLDALDQNTAETLEIC